VSLVLDTGPVLALLDADDPAHRDCVDLVEGSAEDLVVPAAILVEVDYWLRKLLGMPAVESFFEDLARGSYRLVGLDAAGYRRAAALEATYADLSLGLVDAAVIVTCEVLGETKVATLDRRHFCVVRPGHTDHLILLP